MFTLKSVGQTVLRLPGRSSMTQVRAMSERSASTPTKRSDKPFIVKPEEHLPLWLQTYDMTRIYHIPMAIRAVVDLEVPNIIGSETLSTQEIADRVGGAYTPRVDSLMRCLRLLATRGLFVESAGPNGEHMWSLTPAGAMFQSGVPGQPSNACSSYHLAQPAYWNAWGALPENVSGKAKTNHPFAEANGGVNCFEYTATREKTAAAFNECMTFFSMLELPFVVNMYPWALDMYGKHVVDVGGSLGGVMAAVKAAHPQVRATVFDLPEVIASAKAANQYTGIEYVAGDMFKPETIPHCDMIFMKHILHDWSDEDSTKILRSCIQRCNKVVIADAVLPNAGEKCDTNIHYEQAMLDLHMLTIGGKERTKDQWHALAASAGLKVESFEATPAPVCSFITMVKA